MLTVAIVAMSDETCLPHRALSAILWNRCYESLDEQAVCRPSLVCHECSRGHLLLGAFENVLDSRIWGHLLGMAVGARARGEHVNLLGFEHSGYVFE